jgi:protein-S-isoprenylcysteine O-methyltransferase Ste14
VNGEGLTPYFVGPLETALFAASVVLWLVVEFRTSLNRRTEATRTDRGTSIVLRLCFFAGFLLAQAASRIRSVAIPPGAVTFGIGLVVMWVGMGLRWWSFKTLGRYFTFIVMTSPDQRVIASGPYRFVRHPSYSGMLLILSGIALAVYGNWLSEAAVIVFSLTALLYRIRIEEAALSSALGDAYASYAAGRKRLVPFVW